MKLPLFPTPTETQFDSTPPARRLEIVALWCAEAEREAIEGFVRAAGLDVGVRTDAGLPSLAARSSDKTALPAVEPPAGGYALELTAGQVAVRAADQAGLYAALQSLWQLIEWPGDLPQGRLLDAPHLAVRSFQCDLGRQPESLAELKRIIRQQARYHYNECQLYLENAIKLPAFGDAANPDGLSVAEFRELADFAAALGMDVVPSLNLLGHVENLLRHPSLAQLSETRHGHRHPYQTGDDCLCPALPESRRFVADVIAEMAAASRSAKLMVGLDECWTLGSHPESRKRLDPAGNAGPLFRDWIRFLHAEVTRHGKQMWMWEDMLFYHLGALGEIPSDIGMVLWHYEHISEYPRFSFLDWRQIDTIDEISRRGHPVMLCGGAALPELHSLLRYGEGYPLDGVLVCQWEGAHTVPESQHVGRMLAAGLLWSGESPDIQTAARVLARRTDSAAMDLADLLVRDSAALLTRGGGSGTCPRFLSWPDNARALPEARARLAAYDRLEVRHEALGVRRAFLAAEVVNLTADWAREQAALVGRRMIARGCRHSPVLDEAAAALRQACELARSIRHLGREFQERYCAGIAPRPMVDRFNRLADGPEELLGRIEAFRQAPSVETWPFCAMSVHLDGLAIDPSAHRVTLSVSDDGESYSEVYQGPVRLPRSLEGEFCMSWPLDRAPVFVRLEVGGFAAVGVTRLRLESLAGTRTARRLVESAGEVIHPEHLLDFDRKVAVFNQPDIFSNWQSLQPLPPNYVVLEF